MRLTGLKFRHVGPFGAEGIALEGFTPGLNVICETNEFGKSTILTALEIVLFKPFGSGRQDIRRLSSADTSEGPEGEVTFEVDNRAYIFHKRFLKKKSARLQDARTGETLAVDREAEETLSHLIRADKYQSGPSGLLWVRQGRSMDGVKDDGQVASRLEGELGTLIGGDKARDYLARVEADLAVYLTPRGIEKKSGPLHAARQAVAATREALADTKRLRDTTKSIGIELSRVEAEIERLTQESLEDDTALRVSETGKEIIAARSYAQELALLVAKRDQISDACVRAVDRQTKHIESVLAFNNTQSELLDVQTIQQSLKKSLSDTQATRNNLRAEIDIMDAQMTEWGQARSRRETFARQKMRLEEIKHEALRISNLIEELDRLEHQQSELTDQLADIPIIRRTDIEPLRRAEDRVRHVQAELSALSTRLFLDLSPKGKGKVTIKGRALDSGAFELAGDSVLDLAGIGQLRSDDSRLRELTAEHERAISEFEALLAEFDTVSVEAAIIAADRREALETDRKHVTADIARFAPQGRTAIETDQSNLAVEAEELMEVLAEIDSESDETDETQLVDELRGARARLDILEEQLAQARIKFAQTELEQARLSERLIGLNLSEGEAERQVQADKLAGETLKLESESRAVQAEVEAMMSKAPAQSLDILQARLKRLEHIEKQATKALESLKQDRAVLAVRRDTAFEGEDAQAKLGALEMRLEQEETELQRHQRLKDARLLLRDTLVQAQSRLQDAYTAPVAEELAPLLSMVIPGAQAGLGETLGVDTIQRSGRIEALSQLSGGTREQFAILTRLAYARLLARGGAKAPVILDDALVYADDGRRDAMFDVLNHVSSGEDPIQIIYLSCQKGATSRLGGHLVSPCSWNDE